MAKRRDVVLAQVFFSDSPESKIRPAIVLSDDNYSTYNFLLLAPITTSVDDYCLPLAEKDANCALDKGSAARFDGIVKIHRKQVVRVIGKVAPEFHRKLVDKIISMVEFK